MKKIINILLALTFMLSIANTARAQVEDDAFVPHPGLVDLSENIEQVIPTIMSLQVADLLEENVTSEILTRVSHNLRIYQSTPEFRSFYWEARSVLYGHLWNHKRYDDVRIMLVTRVKNYLHQPGKLQQLYATNRDQMLERLQSLTMDQRGRIGLKLLTAQRTFAKMKDPSTAEIFNRIDEIRKKIDRDLMRENLPDEEVAQTIVSGEAISYWDFDDFRREQLASFPDEELAEFAWRRQCEGGDVLIDEYLKVIESISVDLLSIKDKG